MRVDVISDTENKLLGRREVMCVFPEAAGKLTRAEAVDAVARHLKVDKGMLHLISIRGRAGSRDVHGVLYEYKDKAEAKRQLPPHVMVRVLPKEERMKIREEARKAKAAKAVKAGG